MTTLLMAEGKGSPLPLLLNNTVHRRQSRCTDGAVRAAESPHHRSQPVAAKAGGCAGGASGRVMHFKKP